MTNAMSGPFRSSRLKLDRAKYHIHDLDVQITRFTHESLREIVIEPDPTPGYKVYKFRLLEPAPLDDFAVVTGDAVNNLRAALDNAVYSRAVLNGHASPRHKTCSFPFGPDKRNFLNAVKGCTSVPDSIRTCLESLRAYKDVKEGNVFLWALNDLCNRDKHALITPLLTGFEDSRVVIRAGSIEPPTNRSWLYKRNEIELFRTNTDVEYDLHVSLAVAINEPDVLARKRLVPILERFATVVEAVLATLETEAKRIKLFK